MEDEEDLKEEEEDEEEDEEEGLGGAVFLGWVGACASVCAWISRMRGWGGVGCCDSCSDKA